MNRRWVVPFWRFCFVALLLVDETLAQVYIHKTLANGSPIVGRETESSSRKSVEEFLGIPFAQPPVGNLRFRKPVRVKPWSRELKCLEPPNSCPQTPDTYWNDFPGATMWNADKKSEDCLYLNVWVPKVENRRKPLSVMVWVYGGGFWSGTSTLDVYDGKTFAAEEEVIIVSMNYCINSNIKHLKYCTIIYSV